MLNLTDRPAMSAHHNPHQLQQCHFRKSQLHYYPAGLNTQYQKDNQSNYLGAMVTWSIVTEKLNLISDLSTTSSKLQGSALQLTNIANNLASSNPVFKSEMQLFID
jgi:hypothetical protein